MLVNDIKRINNNVTYRYLLKYNLILTYFFFIIFFIILRDNFVVNAVKIENNNMFIIKWGKIYIILSRIPFILYVKIKPDILNPITNDL